MEVTKLVVNGTQITLIDKPLGLDKIKVSLDRDFVYSGIDTKIDIDLRFYCASGKTAIDSEYENKGVEGSGYVEISDVCGMNTKITRFKLDFKKYKFFSDYTTLGLLQLDQIGSDYLNWKEDLNKDVNLNVVVGQISPFYVRNLPLKYIYESDLVYARLNEDTLNNAHGFFLTAKTFSLAGAPPPSLPPPIPIANFDYFNHYIMPRVEQKINELEYSDGLLMDYFTIQGVYQKPSFNTTALIMDVNDISGTTITNITESYSEIEPTPIFTNENVAGVFNINTNNSQLDIFINNVTIASWEIESINEILSIGKKFDAPRYVIKNVLSGVSGSILQQVSPINISITYASSKVFSLSYEVRENENVWIYYEIVYRQTNLFPPTYNTATSLWDFNFDQNIFFFNDVEYKFTNNISATFTLNKNVKNSITSTSDIEPYHTKTKAYLGGDILNKIFNTGANLSNTLCYQDLWFSRGDYLRGKINAADFIVKPSEFFRELEKIICCGLGLFYDNSGNATKELKTVFDFYSDTLVETFQESDIIDGQLTIEPFPSVFYKDIQIGYNTSKDSPFDLCKQNDYSINNNSSSVYSKVSDIIASQYIITRALRLGTGDEEKEFDKNIFILSGKTIAATPNNYNVTLSETTGLFGDTIVVSTNNVAGINRRYATALNLFRHLYKWGFSLFSSKDKLTANKYEGNSIYTEEIRSNQGVANTSSPYFGLNDCMLPRSENVPTDKTIKDITTDFIDAEIHVPSVITFKTLKYSSISLLEKRKDQYGLFKVVHNGKEYYGNLISADLEDDATDIKLLRRFKNGL